MCIYISLIGIGLFLKSKTSFVISSQVTLSLNLREWGASISVKNQLGQTVLVETLGEVNNVLNVEKLEDGIYIIELNFNSGKQIVKFVKQ